MADITIICGSCGNRISVSEFVEAEFLTCLKCKTAVPIPKEKPAGTEATRPKLSVKADEPAPPPAAAAPPEKKRRWLGSRSKVHPAASLVSTSPETVQAKMPSYRRRVRQRRRHSWGSKAAPWILFIILTLVLVYLRYWPGALPQQQTLRLIHGSIAALALIHVTVIVYAFGEDPFQGVLCALIPFYTIYFLFTQADQYSLRAVAAALLIAFGWDTSIAIRETWLSFYRNTNAWLQDSQPKK